MLQRGQRLFGSPFLDMIRGYFSRFRRRAGPKRQHGLRYRAVSHESLHSRVDAALPVILLASGLLHPAGPAVWYACFGVVWAALLAIVLGGAGVVHLLSQRIGDRIQGPRLKPAPIGREAFETARAMFVAATLAAWPAAQWWQGQETGMVLSLASRGLGTGAVVAQMLAGVVAMDAWLYWKHRLLHTRLLFGFHKAHHAFRDPTPFAGFAVAPVESLLTFWPILLLCWPVAVHWTPLYVGLVLGFVTLNFYLHCGVTIGWVERVLPRALFNTSAFHNLHHAKASTHFGEAMTLWDHLCGTTAVRFGRSTVDAPAP